jgi:hypothetical protein
VVEYQGKIAQTFSLASSGGRTESVENSFYGAPVPYLKSVRDPYDYYSPLHKWTLRLSAAQDDSRLALLPRRAPAPDRGDGARRLSADRLGAALRDRRVTKIRGDSLEYALGGYDRWMHFRSSSRQARAPRRCLVEDGCARDRAGAAGVWRASRPPAVAPRAPRRPRGGRARQSSTE